ncbi:atherin-like isoform X2 [Podarcis raffonei]|uniref:atherin-like isoform X2 n=1 Tax=Podarcis raffonei TaxID=65483 RepID=UPI0023292699|nr:atherin-like isoform X2 [Podarcis raffonei]
MREIKPRHPSSPHPSLHPAPCTHSHDRLVPFRVHRSSAAASQPPRSPRSVTRKRRSPRMQECEKCARAWMALRVDARGSAPPGPGRLVCPLPRTARSSQRAQQTGPGGPDVGRGHRGSYLASPSPPPSVRAGSRLLLLPPPPPIAREIRAGASHPPKRIPSAARCPRSGGSRAQEKSGSNGEGCKISQGLSRGRESKLVFSCSRG